MIVLVSSSELYRPGLHFLIPKEHPNFPATGLTKTSFVLGGQIRDLPIEELDERLGRLEGELAKEFDKWID